MLVEKAWAKVCGSYEATELTAIVEAFEVLAGGPTQTYDINHYKQDIRRVGEAREERLDKLWKVLDEANRKGWVTTLTSGQMPTKSDIVRDEESLRWATIDGKGIKYNHTYTVLDARPVTLANAYTDLILLVRNPTNKNSRGEQWKGDWNPLCDLWTKKTKQQVGPLARNTSPATFWMSLQDVLLMFRYITINHSDPTFERRVIPCDVPPLTKKSKKVESWGVLKIQINKHANVAFFRLFQLAERFANVELDQKGNKPTWEDPEITMMVVKKAKCPPRGGSSTCETEYAFLEGIAAKSPSVGVRIDSMRGGEYLVIYKADWKPYH